MIKRIVTRKLIDFMRNIFKDQKIKSIAILGLLRIEFFEKIN